ncbi:SOS response-associated peptidase family protein, partial [Klebsiella pneumoniae]
MCGRFAQAQSREEYLAHLVEAAERDIAWDPAPIGRYNVAPGTKVLLLNERDEQLHLDAVYWGYAPGWWDKPPLINARVETAASSRMFKPLWEHGRAICFADGWFEWKKEGNTKQPYFIQRKDGQPIFMAAIGRTPFERGDHAEGFLIVTASLYIDLCNCLILICSIQHQMKVNLWTKNSYRLWLTNWPKTS